MENYVKGSATPAPAEQPQEDATPEEAAPEKEATPEELMNLNFAYDVY